MNQHPDQRAAARQPPAEAFLIEAHAGRAKSLEAGMEAIVQRNLAREDAEERSEQA